jgi:hypothetical protein
VVATRPTARQLQMTEKWVIEELRDFSVQLHISDFINGFLSRARRGKGVKVVCLPICASLYPP